MFSLISFIVFVLSSSWFTSLSNINFNIDKFILSFYILIKFKFLFNFHIFLLMTWFFLFFSLFGRFFFDNIVFIFAICCFDFLLLWLLILIHRIVIYSYLFLRNCRLCGRRIVAIIILMRRTLNIWANSKGAGLDLRMNRCTFKRSMCIHYSIILFILNSI